MMRLLVSAFLLQLVAGVPPEVTVGDGKLLGVVMETINGRKFDAFLGIPYAKPPVGKHRFKVAVPNEPWTGVWNATQTPNYCLQYNYFYVNTPMEIMGSEDCLYVNVFTPQVPKSGSKPLDVLVHIHGGGFQFLAGEVYGPEYILDRDIVYVTFNYRLGTLGFLSFEDDVLPGNNGLKDQNLALKWINQNIAAFGGDPKRITISGMSAGGASVHFHLLSKQSRGLFQKAITNSGAVSNPWALARNIRAVSLKIAAHLGCPTDDTSKALQCLRQRPGERVVEAVKMFKVYKNYWPVSTVTPIIEKPGPSAFIDKQPYDIIKDGEAADVPILWTYNNDEGQFLGIELIADKSGRIDEEWDYLMPHILELTNTVSPAEQKRIVHQLKEHYLGGKKIAENPGGLMKVEGHAKNRRVIYKVYGLGSSLMTRPYPPNRNKLLGDRYFYNGIPEAAKLHAEFSQSPSWLYRFSYVGADRYTDKFDIGDLYKGGACHGDDTLFVLRAFYAPLEGKAEDRKMIKSLTDVWMNFIQDSMPSSWPTLKSGLPDLTFLDIVSSDPKNNVVKTEKRTPGQELWLSFALPENSAELINSARSHSEL